MLKKAGLCGPSGATPSQTPRTTQMAAFATLVFFLASFLLGAFTVLIVGVAVTYHYLSLLSSTKTDTNARSTASKGGQSLSGSCEHPALDGVSNDEKAVRPQH